MDAAPHEKAKHQGPGHPERFFIAKSRAGFFLKPRDERPENWLMILDMLRHEKPLI